MGLFSNLKKLKLRDIGTGKNLKKIGKGLKQMKFKEGLGLLGLGLGGAALGGAFGGAFGNFMGGAGKWLGGGLKNVLGKELKQGAKGLLSQALKGGQVPQQPPPIQPPSMQMPTYGGVFDPSMMPQQNPMGQNPYNPYSQSPPLNPNMPIDQTRQVIDTSYSGWG